MIDCKRLLFTLDSYGICCICKWARRSEQSFDKYFGLESIKIWKHPLIQIKWWICLVCSNNNNRNNLLVSCKRFSNASPVQRFSIKYRDVYQNCTPIKQQKRIQNRTMIHTAVFCKNVGHNLTPIFRGPGATSRGPSGMHAHRHRPFLRVLCPHGAETCPSSSESSQTSVHCTALTTAFAVTARQTRDYFGFEGDQHTNRARETLILGIGVFETSGH